MSKLTDRDLEMWKLTCEMELPLVADKLNISVNAVRQRYFWIRKKRVEAQLFVNQCNNADKMCPKLKKMLTSSGLKKGF